MSVTNKLKAELGDAFLEVRGKRPEKATVTLYREIWSEEYENAFWPWAVEKEGSYDTQCLKMSRGLKKCLLEQEAHEKHADGKHRVYTIEGGVDTVMRIYETREEKGTVLLDNLFSQFKTVKEELETVKESLERPLLVATLSLPATNLHETRKRAVTSLCRMIASEDAGRPAPEVYDRLLEESEKFREKHKQLEEALKSKVNRLQEAVDFVEKCRESEEDSRWRPPS